MMPNVKPFTQSEQVIHHLQRIKPTILCNLLIITIKISF